MSRITKKIIAFMLVMGVVLSIGIIATSAADIGYTDPVTIYAKSSKIFNGVSRIKEANGGSMVVNTTHGGSRAGYANLNGNPIQAGNFLQFNCRKTSNQNFNCCTEGAYVFDNQRKASSFKTGYGVAGQGYYLYLFNNASASTITCRMTWTPS